MNAANATDPKATAAATGALATGFATRSPLSSASGLSHHGFTLAECGRHFRQWQNDADWIAAEGQTHGRVKITDSAPITPEDVKAKQEEHQLPANTKLPKLLHRLMLAEATRLAPPVPYWQPDLALGWNVYRAAKNDLIPAVP